MSGWTVPGYTELGPLGSGATGNVVAAIHDESGTQVAIKYLSPRLREDPQFIDRFRAEAGLLAGLQDPNVVRFYQYLETDTDAALVMELVDGVTLRTLMKESGPLSPEAALLVMRGSLLGLAAAHAVGIVHRDYKPANVLIDPAGVSKLADFGIAERAGSMMPAVGTPNYMAPEQWEGAPARPVSDIYATTATFFECLTGRVPYSAETLFELQAMHRSAPIPLDEVPPEVQTLVAHGLAKDAEVRPHDAAAFVAELEIVAGAAYGEEWERRGRKWLALAVGALAALFPLALMDGGLGTAAGGAGGGAGAGAGASGGGFGGIGTAASATITSARGSKFLAKKSAQAKAAIAAVALATVAAVGVAVAAGIGSGGAPVPGADPTSPIVVAAAGTGTESPSGTAGGPLPSDSTTGEAPTGTPAPSGTPATKGASSLGGLPTTGKGTTSSKASKPPTGTATSAVTTPSGPTMSTIPPYTTPVTTTTPPLKVTVTVTAQTGSYVGTCPPPNTATSFVVLVTVSGTVPKGLTINYHWHSGNGGDSDPSPRVMSFTAAGQQRELHYEYFYPPVGSPPISDHIMVDWSIGPNGTVTTSNSVPISITCQYIS